MSDALRTKGHPLKGSAGPPGLGPPLPPHEDVRLRVLRAHGILDTAREDAYDEIVQLAAEICETPIALLSLVDQQRQWFKSVVGLDVLETPWSVAFCGYTILEDQVMIVPDAQRDERFANNPLVTSSPNIRFYAGTPLHTTDGYRIGTLCVIDRIAKELTSMQQRALVALGKQVETQLALRLKLSEFRAREAELRRERDTLCRTQQQKDELVSLVIHDLKSPLASLLPNARFIVEEPSASEDVRLAASDIVDAAETMNRMVMNLLDISRSEDGRFTLKVVEVDLGALLEELHGAVLRRAQDSRIKVMVSTARDAQTVQADEDLLRRVLENLLDNALKYSPPGGTIHLDTRRQDDAIELRVRDEGPGIPRSAREKVFQKYMQLDQDVLVQPRAGRGLGLTFCQLAAEAHGGKIWIEDNEPRGTVFCLRLPWKRGAAC
jgi:signal transduction histidine kinase